jgi:hypothetical protein
MHEAVDNVLFRRLINHELSQRYAGHGELLLLSPSHNPHYPSVTPRFGLVCAG